MKPRLRVVAGDNVHPRDKAAQAVRKRRERLLEPVVNQHAGEVKPLLRVDEVLQRSDPGCLLGKK